MATLKRKRKYLAFEHRSEPPIPKDKFFGRLAMYFALATSLVIAALGVGVIGYHVSENMSWTDSFLNASMILGGMGPVNELHTEAGKLFAGMYALFSGLVFVAAVGLVIAPLFHRLLHRFHFEADD